MTKKDKHGRQLAYMMAVHFIILMKWHTTNGASGRGSGRPSYMLGGVCVYPCYDYRWRQMYKIKYFYRTSEALGNASQLQVRFVDLWYALSPINLSEVLFELHLCVPTGKLCVYFLWEQGLYITLPNKCYNKKF